MTTVRFYDTVFDEKLKFAVIVAKSDGKLIFCKHRERNTYEIPGGHREQGEPILTAAKRELYEETGATDYTITPICVYSVTSPSNFNGEETFGMLYFADVKNFETELYNEIEKIVLLDTPPIAWTYPDIQPALVEETKRRGFLQ